MRHGSSTDTDERPVGDYAVLLCSGRARPSDIASIHVGIPSIPMQLRRSSCSHMSWQLQILRAARKGKSKVIVEQPVNQSRPPSGEVLEFGPDSPDDEKEHNVEKA